MTTVCTRTIAILMIGIVVSLIGPPAWAESITVYHTDFSTDTPGQAPAGWSSDSIGTWTVNDSNQLIVDTDDDSSLICPAGVLTDYTVSATFEFNTGRAGLVGRLQDAESYYVARLRANRRFELMWVGPNDTYGTFQYLTVPSDKWAAGDWVTMSMTFDGDNISAELRNAANDVWTLSGTDTRYASGTTGVRAQDGTYTCSEFTVTAPIPEPGTVALLISALAGLLMVRCKP